jgi:imidazolonepropionase-like amidohydrolase
MNDDGSWFGSVDPVNATVPEGWERTVAPLVEAQNAADRRRDAAVVARIAHRPPPAGLAFVHARVLDVTRGRWVPDQTVVVVGDTIASVSPSKGAKVPAGAEVIDLAGKALLPGLWDMHAHLSTPDGPLDIASGVTTVRDVGNEPDKLDDFKKRFDEGSAVGPHVYRMGFVEGRGEKAASSTITAETPEEARAAVAFFAKRGYDGMKIYNSIRREFIPIIAQEAHARGMTVTGHIPVHVLAADAVGDGYDGIEHLNMIFLNFLATHETDTRDTTRFTLVGEKAAALDLAGKPVKDFLALLKKKGTVVDPTVNVFEDLLLGKPGRVLPGLDPLVVRLPVQVARGFLLSGMRHEGKEEVYQQSWEKCLAMIRTMAEAKITLVAGTDALAGLMLHHEIALFVRAGITPADALRMATLVPARVMKKDKVSGSVDKGKVADLVVVDGDPLTHIEDLGKVVTTVKSGVLHDAAALYATVGVKPN